VLHCLTTLHAIPGSAGGLYAAARSQRPQRTPCAVYGGAQPEGDLVRRLFSPRYTYVQRAGTFVNTEVLPVQPLIAAALSDPPEREHELELRS